MRYSRISITLPPDVLAEADRLAREQDRSRSWVIADAVRRLATKESPTGRVREAPAGGYAAAVEQGRLHQLRHALGLSPAERLRRAQELVRLYRTVHPRRPRAQIVGFETLEDFAEWKRARTVAG